MLRETAMYCSVNTNHIQIDVINMKQTQEKQEEDEAHTEKKRFIFNTMKDKDVVFQSQSLLISSKICTTICCCKMESEQKKTEQDLTKMKEAEEKKQQHTRARIQHRKNAIRMWNRKVGIVSSYCGI